MYEVVKCHYYLFWGGGGRRNKIDAAHQFAQWCPTLCDPVDCSLPGSSLHGILQARVLEWVAIPFSRESSWPRDWTQVSLISGRRFNLWATREATWSKLPFSLSTRCMGSWNKVTSFNSHALSTYHVWSDLWNMLHFIVSDICFLCEPHNNSLGLGTVEVVTSRLGVRHLRDLIPDDLRCSQCNNNRCNNKSAQ